jgi:SAM-dependent methyltransferase
VLFNESVMKQVAPGDVSRRRDLDGGLANDANRIVRDFYERMPYPAPLTQLAEGRAGAAAADRRRTAFYRMFPTGDLRPGLQILIAGCGTSQAARHALRHPDAHVTAIDISTTSLHHTRNLQQQYGLRNLALHWLPIEEVGALGRRFDQIVCTGVLHHLPDPDLGLRALRDVLAPEGALELMVYAPYGRAGIYMMQDYCRRLGVTASETDLRELAAILRELPPDHPIAGVLRHAKDFQQPAAMADALLHPLDRAYSVPELYDWLEHCGMRFGRWVEQAPYLPQCGLPAKSAHAARLASLPTAQQHAALELFRGTMVTHSAIAYRDDRVEAAQPITFEGERWRGYVPIALPSVVCVRDGVPAGSVAVLINRAHRFTDLICTVDQFEDPLLGAIDGTRTLGGILALLGIGESRERAALSFFERLWHYDQVVFNASGVASDTSR